MITYTDKVSISNNPNPDINKVTDTDMNQIKSVVNTNESRLDDVESSSSASIYTTSGAGAVSDANLDLGSTTFGTDNTTVIQTLFSIVGPKIIIVDGQYSTKGITVNDNTRVICLPGCGFILRNHADDDTGIGGNLIVNENWEDGLTTSSVNENIEFIGGIYNCNGYNTGSGGNDYFDVANGGSAVNGSAQRRTEPIRLWGIDHLKMQDLVIYGPRMFGIHGVRCNYVTCENVVVDFGDASQQDDANYDGVHFTGPSQFGIIRNVVIKDSKDDALALAACDDYTAGGSFTDWLVDGFTIINTRPNTGNGVRMYASSTAVSDRITLRNIKGQSRDILFYFQKPAGETQATYGTIVLEDFQVDLGDGTLSSPDSYFSVDGIFDHLIMRNMNRGDFSVAFPYIEFESDADVRHLQIDGLNMRNKGTAFAQPIFLIKTGAIVSFMELSNVYVDNTNQTTSAIVRMTGGLLGWLKLNSVTANNITNIFNHSGGTVSGIIASNIYHTANSAPVSFVTSGTIAVLTLSNYYGPGATKTSGTWTLTAGDAFTGAGTGDVVGPSSATDNMTVVFDSTTGKLIKEAAAPINWTASLGVTGFSGTPTTRAYYRDTGREIFFDVAITGTSNATTLTFALPVAPSSTIYTADMPFVMPVLIQNTISSVTTGAVGRIVVTGGSTTVSVERDANGTAFTASGVKTVRAHFRYFK